MRVAYLVVPLILAGGMVAAAEMPLPDSILPPGMRSMSVTLVREQPTKKTSQTLRPIVVQEAVSPAKARRLAQTLWPELSQAELDRVTARAQAIGPTRIRIFCFDEVKCGDLASSLENAFESAHWTVEVKFTPSMIPDGMQASPKALDALSTIDPGFSLTKQDEPEPEESITIGVKPKGRLE